MKNLPDSFGSLRTRRELGIPQTLARSQAVQRSWPFFLDLIVACIGLAAFYGVVQIARLWLGQPQPNVVLSLSPQALPRYAFYSVVRMGLAYILSLLFAVGYGYVAAYSRRLEALMIAALDILQSIPVLSFLPGVMLAMVALFRTRQIGLELGCIVLIFTGQVWNMAFSFYSSLKSLPRELTEASAIYGFSRWQRLLQLELPYAAIGLIWNSMVSVAGGWFFLMACEMFVLGSRDFRLPGLGSYLQTAASEGNTKAIFWGLMTMILIIVATDQLLWRPIIAWSDRFKFEQVESSRRVRSPLLSMLQQSNFVRRLGRVTFEPLTEKLYRHEAKRRSTHPQYDEASRRAPSTFFRMAGLALILIVVGYAAVQALHLLRSVDRHEVLQIFGGAGMTLMRVVIALVLATLWTVPAGVAIGFHPRLARIAQPLAQIAASVPATALFPVLLLLLFKTGAGMGTAAVLLMLLGTQWYVLFNVIAGAMAIPNDLKEVARLFRFSTVQRWRTVILPGIFPYLLTGLITASGGAWNASIIAEYFRLKSNTLTTFGLGEQISAATDAGRFAVLLLATIVMALMVVTINRLIWRPLFRIAESKYKLGA
ncbi:ABC-type anion transport system, duplicated permease component [Terriglobus roseus DSM 18391]|uniref:ABC-type anion transport system, duplicated permease component n=1 Tax=Terriglobus roseus (strain DSM 18391 / NRRL B-41598 / KBS 63) TaxID=926566 RepID=I3ZET8_TERRK|nr:ABC transporter permease subunit [Terriglobus roseus]AFL87756.1 ABC-type anion transport system, duplicated permease component [Terriglobus roseus DSM 18391]